MRHAEHLRLSGILNRARPRQRVDAVLHRADAFKQAGHFPHDPVRHALQPKRHGGGRRDRTDAHFTRLPQPQRRTRHAQNQAHAQRMVDDLKRTDEPHLAVARGHELLHRRTRKSGFAVRVRKQLDGGDVGVGVSDAAGHQRTCIGLLLADMAEPGHKESERADIQRQPEQKRQHQLEVKRARQHRHGGDVNHHRHQHIGQHKQRVAHRQRGLHDLGGQAAGKFVLVKSHALAQHQAVEIPAQTHRKINRQRLVLDDGLQGHHRNAANHQTGQHFQCRSLFNPQPGRRRAAQPVHDAAQHGEQQGLKSRQQAGQHRHQQDKAACAPAASPDKGDETLGRQHRFCFGVRVQQAFKFLEQVHGGRVG